MKKEDETVFYQGKVIGHIETDSDGDSLGIVYDPKSVRPWEIYGFNDIDQLKKEMLNQYNLRVLQGTESVSKISQDTLPTESSKWLQLIEGARVEGDTVILFVKDGNDGARFVCHELLNEKDLAAPVQEPVDEQVAFEDWLTRTYPSGDVDEVQRAWEKSNEYADLYITPQRKPLDEEETRAYAHEMLEDPAEESGFFSGVKYTEEKHGIKENT